MQLRPAQPTPFDMPVAPVVYVAQADTAGVSPTDTSQTPIATLEGIPEQELEGLDRIMLSEDRLPVVLAVVLVVWVGVLLMLARTDRRLSRLERDLHEPDAPS